MILRIFYLQFKLLII